MTLIQQLPEHIRSRIAAGEVVERPANVVKELVENAIDAGASRVEIEISDGGKRLIRVSDNGEGMSPEDLALSIRRHATSKIRDEEDIFRVGTLGFRGEALPSIGSVSEMTITSRTEDSESAWRITVIGGETDGNPVPCSRAVGTTVEVRDLFHHVPARRKFLSSSGGETTRILEWTTRLAIARPLVGIRLRANGSLRIDAPEPVLDDAPNPAFLDVLRARVARIYGSDLANALLPVHHESPDASDPERIDALIGPPDLSYHNQNRLMLFVNGRPVRDKLLIAAVREAYRDRLAHRRHPVAFIHLRLPPREVDVNVHPAKTEVRFLRQRSIFGLVRRTISDTIQPRQTPISVSQYRSLNSPKHLQAASLPQPSLFSPATNSPASPAFTISESPAAFPMPDPNPNSEPESPRRLPPSTPEDAPAQPPDSAFPDPVSPGAPSSVSATNPEPNPTPRRSPDPSPAPPAPSESSPSPDHPESEFAGRVIGQLHKSYILVETPDGLEIIDQHALHERILFEKLKAAAESGSIDIQPVLIALPIDLSPAQAAAIPEIADACSAIGLEVEEIASAAVIRATPAGVSLSDASDALIAFLDEYIDTGIGRADPFRLRRRVIYWTSCKSAIKAGDFLDLEEMRHLLKEYRRLAGPGTYTCPHGRPISVKISRHQIEHGVGRS